MSDYKLEPGERIKIGRDIMQGGYRFPIGTMGTVVSVSETTALVRFDAPPVELQIELETEPFWIELTTCTGYSLLEDTSDTSPHPKD
jgi:hypothetical protein